MAMRSSKIRPAAGKSVRTYRRKQPSWDDQWGDEFWDELNEMGLSKDSDVRHQDGYWQARSMFLRSYQFSEDKNGLKKMLKNKMKMINHKTKLALLDMRRELLIKKKDFGIKALLKNNIGMKALLKNNIGTKTLAMEMDLPMASVFIKCFIPTCPRIVSHLPK